MHPDMNRLKHVYPLPQPFTSHFGAKITMAVLKTLGSTPASLHMWAQRTTTALANFQHVKLWKRVSLRLRSHGFPEIPGFSKNLVDPSHFCFNLPKQLEITHITH